MTYRILHLVRHGQMDPDSTHPDAHRNGWPLTALGRQQAALTGQRLGQLPIQRILHSTYLRADETAQLIGAQIPTATRQATALLCECVPAVPDSFCTWYAAYQRLPPTDIPPAMQPWLDVWTATTSVETIARDAAQVAELLATHFRASPARVTHEVLVSHANLIGALVCHVLGLPAEQWLVWSDLYNCSINEIRIDANQQMRLLSFNDAGHLPYSLRSDNDRSMYVV